MISKPDLIVVDDPHPEHPASQKTMRRLLSRLKHTRLIGGKWVHRPPLKRAANSLLRFVQRGPEKWLIVSNVEFFAGIPVKLNGYRLAKVRCL